MTQIVWGFQCVLVFLVPALFGWTVLRRVVREYDLAVLVPGSVVAGFAAVMVLVDELRYWLEFGPAAWFAYKLMLIATLGLVICTRKPRRRPFLRPDARAPWKIALTLVGAMVTGVYFGIPATAGFLNDAWWGHLPLAVQIQTAERFPLPHPFALDDPLYYHFGPDILAAAWSHLLIVPVARGFALSIIWLTPASFLLGFALALRISKQFWAGLAAGSLVVIGGNLRFLDLIGADLSNAASRLQVFNSQTIQGLIQMVFTPSHATGIPLTLLVLLVLRTFLLRPSWPLASVLGLLLGTLTLCAEWYFLPLFATVALCLALRARQRSGRRHWPALVGVLAIAAGSGLYNNTYLAGLVGHFWIRHPSLSEHAHARIVLGALDWDHATAQPPPEGTIQPYLPPGTVMTPAGLRATATELSIAPYVSRWTVPPLAPLRLNFSHLGYVPSWENAGSNEGTWVPIWSWAFLAELFPVIGLGLPFGIWLWRRTRDRQLLALVVLASFCVVPPVFLDWGYRSTDFLRFFTGAFSFSAVLLGLLIGRLITHSKPGIRWFGAALALAGIANAVGLGVLGLMPSTLSTAKAVSAQGISLSQAASQATIDGAPAASPNAIGQEAAFHQLAEDLDQFLFPISKGRDRAIVIVSPDELPPLKVFPEWMKLATLSRLLLPVGWYWNDSPYVTYYNYSVRTLNWQAVAGVGARWVIVTNLWGYAPPPLVVRALRDHRRFVPARTFLAGNYYLSVYRVY